MINSFAEAATQTAKKICERIDVHQSMVQDFDDIITNAHADLRRTFGKLVKLVKLYAAMKRWQEEYVRSTFGDQYDRVKADAFSKAEEELGEYVNNILADPDIQAAMNDKEGK